jgi:hypothetical protein
MLLDNHIHVRPIINLDHKTGNWCLATEEEAPASIPLVDIKGIVGSYIKIDNEYFFKYWTGIEDDRVYFRTTDGVLIEIDGYNYAEVVPATDSAGNPQTDFKQFSIYREDGQLLYRKIYYSLEYETFYTYEEMTCDAGKYIFSPPTLADWDFFIYLANDIFPALKERRLEREEKEKTTDSELKEQSYSTPISTKAGEVCPETGIWIAPHLANTKAVLAAGQTMPGPGFSQTGEVIWYLQQDKSTTPEEAEKAEKAESFLPIRSKEVVPKTGLWKAYVPAGHPDEKIVKAKHPFLMKAGSTMITFGLAYNEKDVLWYWVGDGSNGKNQR